MILRFDEEGDGSEDEGTLYSLSTEYMEAAIVLHDTPPIRVKYSSVICYLLGHSAELALKSYLFDHGETPKSLKNIGHNLERLVELARQRGLSARISLTSTVELSPVYCAKGLEYRTRRRRAFPNETALIEEVQALLRAVFDHISDF
ncbi:MAG: hypothetical protein IPJ21_08545 [Sterolibacteriaceae bacterium]|nr:hypothetical protein [Sterolibacteriaceae bacterium]MBK9083916.1 hypothetical protein [Sterolibacteriaceae bacterium]